MNTRPIAAIWARVSTKGQLELSPEGQIHAVKPWLEDMGYEVPADRIITVDWASRELINCPEYQNLLRWIRNGEIAALGAWESGRLGGNPAQKAFLYEMCSRKNVRIMSKMDPVIEGREGALVDYVRTWGKEWSVICSADGALRGQRDRVRDRGLPPNCHAPYGYRWSGDHPPYHAPMVPDENYPVAALIWQRALEGKPLCAIKRELELNRIPTKRGKPHWSLAMLHAILKNPSYTGRIAAFRTENVAPSVRRGKTYGHSSRRKRPASEWVWLDGLVHDPIVNAAQFQAVQERLAKNKAYASRNAKRNYLLRGLIECQLCHCHYWGVMRDPGGTLKFKPGHREIYRCTNKWNSNRPCQAQNFYVQEFDEQVKARVRQLLDNPEIVLAMDKEKNAVTDNSIAMIEQRITKLEQERFKTLEEERKALRLLSEEAFAQEQALLKARRRWLTDEIARQQAEINNLKQYHVGIEMVRTVRDRLMERYARGTDEDWRYMLEQLNVKILSYGDETWDLQIGLSVVDDGLSVASTMSGNC